MVEIEVAEDGLERIWEFGYFAVQVLHDRQTRKVVWGIGRILNAWRNPGCIRSHAQ